MTATNLTCRNHWVLAVLMPREGVLYVYDSDKRTKRMLMITDVAEQ